MDTHARTAWEVRFDRGVWLPQIGWRLDAHFPSDRSFVSHAHFDHLALDREILGSAGTARLMRAPMPGQRVEHVLPFGQEELLSPECSVTLVPAGRILGAEIEVPEEEVASGATKPTIGLVGGETRPVMVIRTGKRAPSGAYVAVSYRGSDYWIDAADFDSKYAFTVVQDLMALAQTTDTSKAPVVTIGAN